MSNPKTKDIDVKTQEGLELLKEKAKFYGHYAEQLKVLELIDEIENLKLALDKIFNKSEDCWAAAVSEEALGRGMVVSYEDS